MKRLWISLALLAFLLLACVVSALTVDSFSKTTISLLEEATQTARQDDFAAARKLCKSAAETWQSKSSILGALLRHSEADVVETGLMKLISYSETEDKDEFLALCAELIHNIRHVRDMEFPLMRNVL